MKKKFSKFLISICLILTFCFFLTGCNNQGVLQLNTKYYSERMENSVSYYIFTSNTKGYNYYKDAYGVERKTDFIWEYTAEDGICITYTSGNTFDSTVFVVSKNFLMSQGGGVCVAENYLIENNLPYVSEV